MHAAPAVEFESVSKAFGLCQANRNLSFKVASGSIHAIIGENGAGKSTALRMLYGEFRPDSGSIRVHGEAVRFATPRDAIALGIGMVHQHFMLAPNETVLDNVIVGSEPARWTGRLNRKQAISEIEKIMRSAGMQLRLDAQIEDLPVGAQQRVEILKLLYRKARILILDEPTAVLTPQETDAFFDELRRLKAQGHTILLITHKLREVLALSDRITVLRAGEVVGHFETSEVDEPQLATAMVGAPITRLHRDERAFTAKKSFSIGKNLSLGFGEVLGIAGVDGNGQRDCVQSALRSARQQGFSTAYVPGDRHHEAVLLDESVEWNFLLGRQRDSKFQRGGVIHWSYVRESAAQGIADLDVRPPEPQAKMRTLSGGNQQKAVVARELQKVAEVEIYEYPTRGVDLGAAKMIHQKILDSRARGASVLLVSGELDELVSLCDRIAVLYRGEVRGVLERPSFELKQIGLWMGGAQ
jgi:ABC-type uncharacterized transport system ATPase subunit